MSEERWSEVHSRTGQPRPQPQPQPRVTWTIDETTVPLLVKPDLAAPLVKSFRGKGITCQVRPGYGVGGCDLIDSGNSFPTEEVRSRDLLALWLREHPEAGSQPACRGSPVPVR